MTKYLDDLRIQNNASEKQGTDENVYTRLTNIIQGPYYMSHP
jgi:hypothetical protein